MGGDSTAVFLSQLALFTLLECEDSIDSWVPHEARPECWPSRLIINVDLLLASVGLDEDEQDGLTFVERCLGYESLGDSSYCLLTRTHSYYKFKTFETLLLNILKSCEYLERFGEISEQVLFNLALVLQKQLQREGEFCSFTRCCLNEIYEVRPEYVSQKPYF